MSRPKVTVNCIADKYSNHNVERIIEFSDSDTKTGGLISFRRVYDEELKKNVLHVDIYSVDGDVSVRGYGIDY